MAPHSSNSRNKVYSTITKWIVNAVELTWHLQEKQQQ